MKSMISGCLMLLMLGGGAVSVGAQKEETKKAGEAAKEAGKKSGEAAKEAGKATVKATKKGASAVKKAVTGDAHATCVDGTVQAGETEAIAAAACADHGGKKK